MIVEQLYLGCLAQASYLVADEKTGDAAVIDPRRDIQVYLDLAKERGLTLRWALLTHFHADFVSGHVELREAAGARIGLGRSAQAEYAFVPLGDGDTVELGSLRLRVLETPGHTPESVCYLLFDESAGPGRPHAVFTGDTLFVGDVGRPDLMASAGARAEDLAGSLYDSLHEKLLTLPDETIVYPAHGAGSMCGKNLGTENSSTIGTQRRYNYALQPMARDEFVRLLTADQPEPPAYFSFDADLNRKERATLDESLRSALRPLSLAEATELSARGAVVLDVREASEYEAAHWRGSVNIGLSGKFATWAGTVIDRDRQIVLVAEAGREEEAATRLGRIGFDRVAGWLDRGIDALRDRPDLVARTARITAPALFERMSSGDPLPIVDVRSPAEWKAGHIPGSHNWPLAGLRGRTGELPRGATLVLQCQSGYRSAIAVGLLERAGIDEVLDLVGGASAWEAARLPMERG